MVVFVHPLLSQSWLRSISAQNISTKLISGTHPKSRLVLTVLYATVEKPTTWKTPLLPSQLHCPRECLFSPKVALRKVVNVLNDMTPTVLRQANEAGRTQSRLNRTTISHILRNRQSLHRLARARRCLK
jgi:hypothetical protein